MISRGVLALLALLVSNQHVLFADDAWGELETYVVFSDNIEPSLLTKNEHEGNVRHRRDVRRCLSLLSRSGLRRSLLMKVQLVEKYLIKKG